MQNPWLDIPEADYIGHMRSPATFDGSPSGSRSRLSSWICGAVIWLSTLPSVAVPAVTPTGFTSLRALESLFRFVDPDHLVADVTNLGLLLASRRTARLEAGKTFEVLRFRKTP